MTEDERLTIFWLYNTVAKSMPDNPYGSNDIILNGINFIFFRLPLSLLSFYSFIYRFDRNSNMYKPSLISYIICRKYKFCSALEDLFYFIYLISFIVQFAILYKFDKNFKESLKHLLKKFCNCFSCTRSN